MTEDQSALSLKAGAAEAVPAKSGPLVRMFGVGNAGIAMLDTLATPEFAGAEFVAVNTDAASLAASSAPARIQLENRLLRGLGSGGDPERCQMLAEEHFSTLKSACEGADVVFILAGLGGGSGSGIAPVLARAAREAGALVLAFVTLPFGYEGSRRATQAAQALEALKGAADGVIALPGTKTERLINESTCLIDMLRVTGGFLIEGVRGVWQLVTRPGLIQVHFADLCALLRDRHAENAFAFVEASGAGRSREVIEKLLAHPLLDEGRALAEAEVLLVSLTAGRDLTMAEVNRVMEQIRRHAGPAQTIMGAAVDAALKDKLCVTVIAAKHGSQPSHQVAVRPDHRSVSAPGGVVEAKVVVSVPRPAPAKRQPGNNKLVQSQLPLTVYTKGRFDKSEPTLYHGENLDEPTYLRRGVSMN